MNDFNVVPIVVRMLLRDRNQDTISRIVFIDIFSQHTWLCRIDDASWPTPMPTSQLLEALDPAKGSLTVELEDPWARVGIFVEMESEEDGKKTEQTASDKHHAANWSLIEPLVTGDNERRILSKRDRGKLIADRLEEVESSYQTISTLLKQFWKRGMTSEALRTSYANCGAAGKRRTLTVSKTGSPRIIAPGRGINATEEVRRKLRIAADFYLTRKKPKPTLTDAYDYMTKLFFSKKITNAKGRQEYEIEPDAKPTIRQLSGSLRLIIRIVISSGEGMVTNIGTYSSVNSSG